MVNHDEAAQRKQNLVNRNVPNNDSTSPESIDNEWMKWNTIIIFLSHFNGQKIQNKSVCQMFSL